MANKKISELTALGTTPATDDVAVLVDTDAGETKKVSVSDLMGAAPVQSVGGATGVVTTGLFESLEIEGSSGDIALEIDNNAANSANLKIVSGAGNARADFVLDDNTHITLKSQRVGILDTTPGYTLDVNGDGRFTTDLTVGGTLTAGGVTLGGAASDSAAGIVELATTAEAATGTDTTRAVTAAGVKAAVPAQVCIACSDETTDLATGVAKTTFRTPAAMTLTDVRATVTTAPVGSVLTVDINEGGSTILSTKITVDASEKTSTTAATPAVISDAALADDAEITIDIDTIGSGTAGAGLKVWLIGTWG